ncbi:cupin domain-containing protein [Nevskia ramosa]|uniref:cupin domain-containing protein n=1 Tax=Nevskia ramosa TaxID=64002 RepID=UPI003D12CA59
MPMVRRRVVTGHSAEGKSRVASDEMVDGKTIPGFPGYEFTDLWGADQNLRFPDQGGKPAYSDFFPPPNGFRFMEILVPAKAAVEHDTSAKSAAGTAMDAELPGLAASMADDRPGMHRTASVDMICVMEGCCVLVLDEQEVTLRAGDTAIQCGTIHAWLNPFDVPCRFLAIIIAADNESH